MKKYKIILLICSLSVLIFNITFAQQASINNGLSWLLNNQDPAGLWGDPIRTPFRDTCTVIDTLSYLKASNNTSYNNGIQWILNSDAANIDSLSRRILSLSLSGNASQSDIDILISFQNKNGGWGLNYGQLSDSLDTSLSLLALKSANYPDQSVISSALGYLISTQNPDGGFGFYAGDDSNVYMTAVVLKTLSSYKGTYNVQGSINNATAYLLTKQNIDGGFGSSPSTVYETALAIVALINSGQGQALPLQNAVNYITTTQQLNGSWSDDPYSTALAIRALANEKANLSITAGDIYFSNYAPKAGDTITITANIKNTGPLQADNVVVQFYDGDPNAGGVLIGSATIPTISAYGSSQTSILWTVITASARSIIDLRDSINVLDISVKHDSILYNFGLGA